MPLNVSPDYGNTIYIALKEVYTYMPDSTDPYTLLFIIPISVLVTITIVTYLLIQEAKVSSTERQPQTEPKGVRWQVPQIVNVKQAGPNDGEVFEWQILVIKNIGDVCATNVRAWATNPPVELKPRRKKGLSFPSLNGKQEGVDINVNCSAEFIIPDLDPNQDFWIQWKEDGIAKGKVLHKTRQTVLGLWCKTTAAD